MLFRSDGSASRTPAAIARAACGAVMDSFKASRASAMIASASILNASNGQTLIESSRASGFLKADFDAVVKSVSRVPTARIRSASFARTFAAFPPVTPRPPTFSGWSQGTTDFPACVSAIGTFSASAKRINASPASA